jgi:NAD(P) transhydrogenase subunit beta
MCRAMNRSITNVLFEHLVAQRLPAGGRRRAGCDARSGPRRRRGATAYANKSSSFGLPGLATAQAQHAVRELASVLEGRGVTVKYGIHPGGRPHAGHMNVLLAEAKFLTAALRTRANQS